jgi:hypothetical protein
MNHFEMKKLSLAERLEIIKKLVDDGTTDTVKDEVYKLCCVESTPITPESLEGMGLFIKEKPNRYYVQVANRTRLYYNDYKNIVDFWLQTDAYEYDIEEDIFFTSTEQIVEFVKCFQAKEGEC